MEHEAIVVVHCPSGEDNAMDTTELSSKLSTSIQQPFVNIQGGKVNIVVFGLVESDILFNDQTIKLVCNYKPSTFSKQDARIFKEFSITGKELLLLIFPLDYLKEKYDFFK